MKRQTSKMILGGVFGFVVMSIAGWNLAGGFFRHVPITDARSSSDEFSRPNRLARMSAADADALAKMAVIRNAGDAVERTLATIDLAKNIPLSEIPGWLNSGRFNLRDGAEFMFFRELLIERWEVEDPGGLALWAYKDDRDIAISALSSWAKNDPIQVIGFLQLHPNPFVEFGTLESIAKTHPDLVLLQLQKMDLSQFNDRLEYVSEDLIQRLANQSLSALEAIVDNLDNPLKAQVVRIIATEQMKTNPEAEMHKFRAMHDGFERFMEIAHKLDQDHEILLDELPNLPPDWRESIAGSAQEIITPATAERWWNADLAGFGFSQYQEQRVRASALREIASTRPEEALEPMDEITYQQNEGDSTPGSEQRWGIIQNALATHPEKAEELIALLTTDDDRRIARIALDRIAQEKVEGPVAKAAWEVGAPEQWLEGIGTPSSQNSSKTYEFSSALRDWSPVQIAALSAQFRTLPDAEKRHAAKVIMYSVNSSEPSPAIVGDALHYLITNPSASGELAASDRSEMAEPYVAKTAAYVLNLAISNPEAASEWLGSLPDGQAKLWGRLNLWKNWQDYDAEGAGRWFQSLPAAERAKLEGVGKSSGK